jgi:CheY-like chemotaxis protein
VKLAIVEDEVILAMALTMMLEEWGHEVVGTADTEAGAAALVESMQPDAVLMDIGLGRTDNGLRAAHLIRRSSAAPIVFCTGYADSPGVRTEVAAIANTHLFGKPLDEEQLNGLLRRIDERGRHEVPAAFAIRGAREVLPADI